MSRWGAQNTVFPSRRKNIFSASWYYILFADFLFRWSWGLFFSSITLTEAEHSPFSHCSHLVIFLPLGTPWLANPCNFPAILTSCSFYSQSYHMIQALVLFLRVSENMSALPCFSLQMNTENPASQKMLSSPCKGINWPSDKLPITGRFLPSISTQWPDLCLVLWFWYTSPSTQ